MARLAGVSHQTVSRYLRFEGGLKPDTMERVETAIRQLDYRPNLVARSMRTRRTGRLAIVIPAMAFSPARMLAGASAAAAESGYMIEVVSVGGIQERTERLLELADSGQVEGILSLAPVLPSSERRAAEGVAVVVSTDFDDSMRSIGELADGAPVAELMTRLAEWGHRRFYHVAGAPEFASARGRRQTYADTIERLGLDNVGVFDGDWSGESGVEAIRRLSPDNLPTAVIAANDVVAAGVIRGASERGLDVPGDLSVTGWDNQTIGQFIQPSLTTVDIDLEGLGRRGMCRLVAAVRGEAAPSWAAAMTSVIWRESTAAP
ncbi:MAG: LacI family transcriptional regulator [Propionibacteriaceae bacterium]|nr:LacI family transcriptional regulator [Propionibacteriaceae bacterium]